MSQFEEFLNKVQQPNLILERFGPLDIHQSLIAGIIEYLRNISLQEANQFKEEIVGRSMLMDNSFSLTLINKLINNFAGIKENPKNFQETVKSKFLHNSISFSFQGHLEDLKAQKYNINKIINKKEANDDYSFDDKKDMQNLLGESNAVFYFWYLLHQNVEQKKNPRYNFFDMQKSNKKLPNLTEGFSLQNFDHVQRTSHSPTFFVVSMITNLEDIEDDPEKAQFCLVGIYLDNEKLCSYRYELKNINELASMNFFDAMEMLAN